MKSNKRWREVVSEIERVRPDIATEVVQEMFTGPFWEGRYGKSGRTHNAPGAQTGGG